MPYTQPIDQLQPALIVLALILIINIVYLLLLRKKISIGAFVMLNSILICLTSLVLLYSIGTMADEFNQAGDAVSFGITIFVCLLGFVSVLVSFAYLKSSK